MSTRELADTLPRLHSGTDFLLGGVDRLTDDELRQPSGLPGWSRAHLVGHVARNAEAIGRLATWARTGVETPMYAGPDQRNADIEESASYSAGRLRDELASTAADLTGWLVGRGGTAGLTARHGSGAVAVPVAPRWL